MGGLFSHRTAREYIEGYTDPTLVKMSKNPFYIGGTQGMNQTSLAFMPDEHTPLGFYTGKDDYLLTKTYSSYHGSQYITIPSKEYVSLHEVQPYNKHPWDEKIFVRFNLNYLDSRN